VIITSIDAMGLLPIFFAHLVLPYHKFLDTLHPSHLRDGVFRWS
jgi:hypothetical protein